MVPDGVTGLADSIRAALKYSSFVTIVRVVDNFIRKHKTETLKSLRSTKVQIVQKFGGTDQLAREIKTQLILYLSEGDSFDQGMQFYSITHIYTPTPGGPHFCCVTFCCVTLCRTVVKRGVYRAVPADEMVQLHLVLGGDELVFRGRSDSHLAGGGFYLVHSSLHLRLRRALPQRA